MGDVRTRVCDVSASLREDALMVITIEQGVLGLAAVPPVLSSRTWAGIVVVVARHFGLLLRLCTSPFANL